MERKVVITGMGIWSCLGKTLEDVRDSLYTGKSGIIFSQERKDAGFRSALCADVERPDLKPFTQFTAFHARGSSICLYGHTVGPRKCKAGSRLYGQK